MTRNLDLSASVLAWVERFRAPSDDGENAVEPSGSDAFDVVCAGSGDRVRVEPGVAILHALAESGIDVPSSCQEGRLADVEVINHGYSGAGKMEMDMCETIASIDAALYVLDCDWNMSVEMQKQNYEPFVRELRKRRPTTPILLCGGCTQFDKPRAQEVFAHGVYAKLKAEDPALWKNLFFVGGVEMLPKEGEATFDFCHPNDWGSMQMGRVYAEAITKALAGN